MQSCSKLWTIRHKEIKTQLPLLKSWEQKKTVGSKGRVLCMPLHGPPLKGWANHLSHTSGLTPAPISTLTPQEEPAHCSPGAAVSKGTCNFFSLPPATPGGPAKPWMSVLSGLINFYWLTRPWALVGNRSKILSLVSITLCEHKYHHQLNYIWHVNCLGGKYLGLIIPFILYIYKTLK